MGVFADVEGVEEPIRSDDQSLRQMLRLEPDETHQDVVISSFASTARARIEAFIRQRLIIREMTYVESGFPRAALVLPIAPIVSITSVAYVDAAGVVQTLAASGYRLRSSVIPNELLPAFGEVWPFCSADPDSVTVTLSVGMADTDATLPPDLLNAIRIYTAHLYAYRETPFDGEMVGGLPKFVADMVAHHRLWF